MATAKTAKKTAEVKNEVKAASAVVKETATVKEEAPKKTAAKKTTRTATKKTAAPKKETAAKKTTATKTAKAAVANVYIQQNGNEVATETLVEKAKAAEGVKNAKSIDIYVRPEINMVYYVIDGEKFGNFELC